MPEYTLKSGMKLIGTPEQIIDAASKIAPEEFVLVPGYAPKGYYQSSSGGWVRIVEMSVDHLRNALIKNFVTKLQVIGRKRFSPTYTPVMFLVELQSLASDSLLSELIDELSKRK